MNIGNVIWTWVAAFVLCANAPAMENVVPSGMAIVTPPGMAIAKTTGMGIARAPGMDTGLQDNSPKVAPPISQGEFAAIFQQGAKLMKANRFREAADTYTQAINANPNSDYGWTARGFALARMGPANFEQAWQDFSRAIELNPRNDSAFLGRAGISIAVHQDYSGDLNMAAQLGNKQAQQMLQNASTGGGAPQATKPNQKGLSRQQIDRGCAIVGENIECPGQLRMYRHTLEIPEFGRNWKVHTAGVAYQTENTVDGSRWSHVSVGGSRLPDNTLNIAANGTYTWKANGRVMQGSWIKADENTLVLQNAYKGVDWSAAIEKFGADEKGSLILWRDGERLRGF